MSSERRGVAAEGRLPANWEAAAVERYLAGESGPGVAKGLGLPVGRVYGVLHARGVLRPATEARRLEEARRRAVKQREAEPARVDGRVRAIPAGLAAVVVERYAAGESGEARGSRETWAWTTGGYTGCCRIAP